MGSVRSVVRLFAAVFPDDVVLDALVALQSEMPEVVRKTARSRLHLTLRFFGNAPLDDTKARISAAVGGAFEVRLVSAGGFPSSRSRIYAVRAEPTEDVCGLMRKLGDDRPQPHITIGRGREAAAMEAQTIRHIALRANQVVLVNSVMGPKPCYDTIAVWTLS